MFMTCYHFEFSLEEKVWDHTPGCYGNAIFTGYEYEMYVAREILWK